MKTKLSLLALAALTAATVNAQTQGVSKTEIVVGSIQDLSGPLAPFGKQARNGMQLRVEELNEQGGIHGRKIVLKIEDSGYDPRRAVLAAQKMVNQDKIFIMAGHIGTAQNMAAMPIQFEKGVINFWPLTAAREMYEPLHKLKYSFAVPYYEQIRVMLPRIAKEKSSQKVCVHYQDDDFGLEVLKGAEAATQAMGVQIVEKTSFKRGATEFSSQVAKLKSSGCDMVVMGTLIRETIGTMGESRKTGFNPTFLATSGAYTDLIHRLGPKFTDGLYAAMTTQHPYLDDASQPVRFWATKYRTKFNEDPTVFSAYGYVIMDGFIRGAQKAGPNLTTDSFIKAMDSMTIPADIFGSPESSFSATKRLGSSAVRLSQIQDGRWRVVADYPKR
ncbi:MAG: ABC transporter substrate-binding protein [Rubrivivax sp.]|jgi:branched-chain amino acid transport system substrate-binding protein